MKPDLLDRTGIARRQGLGATLAGALLPAWPAWAQAPAGAPRVALVIGNAAYPGAPLRNAVKDAEAMSKALAELGFRVMQAQDAGKAQMTTAIAQASDLMRGQAGVGLLFYAGHAVQLDWRNFLLPVDAQPATAAAVPQHAVDVQGAIQAFSAAGNRLNIVVLDACRDNPFGAAGGGKGLAPMDAPPGTYMAYATAPGHTADDGDAAAGNGLYTRFLLREIARPEARIEDVFKRVRLQVRRASAGRQVPWDSSSLEEDFYFGSGQQVPEASRRDRDAALEEERPHWDRIRASTRAEDFFEYLQRYPNGLMSELAQFRLDQLARPSVRPMQTPANAVDMLPSGVDRFRVGDNWEHLHTDRLKRDRERTVRERVTAIEGGQVIINDRESVFDQMGNVLKSRYGTHDPAMLWWPAELQIGRRWHSAFWMRTGAGTPSRVHMDFRIVGLEEVQVPAGQFKAFKILCESEATSPDAFSLVSYRRWVDPATMRDVRYERRRVTRGQTTEDSLYVLVSQQLAPRA